MTVEQKTTRTAIVTGAARGIVAATAEPLASGGMAVAVLDLDERRCAGTVERIAAAGGGALAVGADVAATIAFLVSEDASFVSGRR